MLGHGALSLAEVDVNLFHLRRDPLEILARLQDLPFEGRKAIFESCNPRLVPPFQLQGFPGNCATVTLQLLLLLLL